MNVFFQPFLRFQRGDFSPPLPSINTHPVLPGPFGVVERPIRLTQQFPGGLSLHQLRRPQADPQRASRFASELFDPLQQSGSDGVGVY